MTSRDFQRARMRSLVRQRGTDSIHDAELTEKDIERALLGGPIAATPKANRIRRAPRGAAAIKAAAQWLARNRNVLRARRDPVVPTLIAQFGLTTKEAIDAIRRANGIERKED